MEVQESRRQSRVLNWVPRLWIGAALLFVLWQSMTYRGIAAFAGEWQFNAFGAYHPAMTFLLLFLILSLPLLLLRRRGNDAGAAGGPLPEMRRAVARLRRLFQVCLFVCGIALLGSVIVAFIAVRLPGETEPLHSVAVSDFGTPPELGSVDLRGRVRFDKTAVYNQDALFFHQRERFVPVMSPQGNQTNFRYFVALPPEDQMQPTDLSTPLHGILREGGLPGEVIQLYRYAGNTISPDYYVLFASTASMRKPYWTDLAGLLALALFFALACAFVSTRLRRIRQAIAEAAAGT